MKTQSTSEYVREAYGAAERLNPGQRTNLECRSEREMRSLYDGLMAAVRRHNLPLKISKRYETVYIIRQ
jgi:hypothetical protein